MMIDFSEFEFLAPSFPPGVHKVIWKKINVGQSRNGSKILELYFESEDGNEYREVLSASEKALSIVGRKLIQLAAYTFGLAKAKSIKAESFEALCVKLNPMLASNTQQIKILITEEEYEGKVYTGLKATDIASPVNSMILDAIYNSMLKRKQAEPEPVTVQNTEDEFEF